ncbi:MAG TPA: GNAT family N-acetyltransferase [Actinomycetes bacterium]|nr:GNAT family N-acetyltransferase [Actinomycetes bacterium]
MPTAIRLATAADGAAVASLLRATDLHYWGSAPPESAYRGVASRLLDPSGDCELALAAADGQPAGFATFAVVYPAPALGGLLYLKDLFVLAAFRGHGIGQELMRFLARQARARGCSRMDWTTETDNPRAMAFYQRLGARPVQGKVYYRLEGQDLQRLGAPEAEG